MTLKGHRVQDMIGKSGTCRGNLIGVAVLFCFGMVMSANCAHQGMPPPPSEVSSTLEGMSLVERYERVSIEVGCLTHEETDPRAIALGTQRIYMRHGFDDVVDFMPVVSAELGNEAVQAHIHDGIRQCP